MKIAHGEMKTERPDLNGKPYTFDLDQDFFHVTLADREVAFSDYFPAKKTPNEYVIIDFDADGRVVGFAMEGVLDRWARRSIRNRLRVAWVRVGDTARAVSLASQVISELGKKTLGDAFPQLDTSGRIRGYALP
jgi:hypothetical protein